MPPNWKIVMHRFTALFQNRGESSGTPGTRTSNVLPDLLSQASPATPPRHDKSSSEEVRFDFIETKILCPVFFLNFIYLIIPPS